MSAHIVDATKEGNAVDAQKRAFLKKFGKYAVAGAGMATLMTPSLSSASNYVVRGGAKEQWRAVIDDNGDFVAAGRWHSKAFSDATNRKWFGQFNWSNEDHTRAKSKGSFVFTRDEQVHRGLWEGKWRFNADNNKWIGKGSFDLDLDGTPDGTWKAWRQAGSQKIRWKAEGL